MSREYPDWVDPRKAAEGRRTYGGSMPMGRMKRLLPLLDQPVGEARFTARFGFDDELRVVIRIEVQAELPLICQRSLGRYIETVRRNSLLGVMDELAEEELLPGHYEPVLAEHGRLALANLVEDELLLGLPQVPRNPETEPVELSLAEPPSAAVTESPAAGRKPFAGLAEQLKKQRRERGGSR